MIPEVRDPRCEFDGSRNGPEGSQNPTCVDMLDFRDGAVAPDLLCSAYNRPRIVMDPYMDSVCSSWLRKGERSYTRKAELPDTGKPEGRTMIKRRDILKFGGAAGTALCLNPRLLLAAETGKMITREIPSSGEKLPLMGLGSSATFSRLAGSGEIDALREVLRTLTDNGGTVFDTAPSYGDSEEVAGEIVNDLGVEESVFWATKVNVAPRGGGSADPDAARAQIETSFRRIGTPAIDLIQVHNLADIPTQLGILKELKEEGRVRYIGTTSTNADSYDYLAQVMRREPLDFIGVDYAVDNRESADIILPLAQERGIAVLVYLPFGRTRLWNRVAGSDLPEWAEEFDATSWAQFFLKFVAAHPAVTAITPATSKPHHMLDNIGGAIGRLPDQAMQERMVRLVDALPAA
jgi:aryl-alcohol dehydrogenase-like predicted oxidoreductase